MINAEGRLARALEDAIEDLGFSLDAASVDFEVEASPNTNQYIIVYADGERHAYVTAETSVHGVPVVFVDIYSVADGGQERWVHGGLEVDDVVPYIRKDLCAMASEAGK